MLTPSDLVHIHLLLNHFPTIGMIVGSVCSSSGC
jgi:hypothetical protein